MDNLENKNQEQNACPQWTAKALLRQNPVEFLGLTGMGCIAASILQRVLAALGIYGPFTSSIFWIFLAAALAFLAIRWKIFLRNRYLNQMSPEEAVQFYEEDRKFKWNPLYSILLVGMGWFLVYFLFGVIISQLGLTSGGLFFVFFVVSIAVAVLVHRWFNRAMIEKTQTNKKLLDEMEQGKYWDEIPDALMNEEDVKKIVKKLAQCKAYTVKDAVRSVQTDKLTKKAAKITAIISVAIGGLLAMLFSSCSFDISKELSDEIMGSGSGDDGSSQSIRENEIYKENERLFKKHRAKKIAYAELDWAKNAVVGSSYQSERINAAKYWFNEARKLR